MNNAIGKLTVYYVCCCNVIMACILSVLYLVHLYILENGTHKPGCSSMSQGILCGTLGHAAASKFVRAIFQNVKVD